MDYMSKEDFELYTRAMNGQINQDEANSIIAKLLLRLRDESKAAHAACRY